MLEAVHHEVDKAGPKVAESQASQGFPTASDRRSILSQPESASSRPRAVFMVAACLPTMSRTMTMMATMAIATFLAMKRESPEL